MRLLSVNVFAFPLYYLASRNRAYASESIRRSFTDRQFPGTEETEIFPRRAGTYIDGSIQRDFYGNPITEKGDLPFLL